MLKFPKPPSGIRWQLLSFGTNSCDGCRKLGYVMRFRSYIRASEFYYCADCLVEIARELERLDGRQLP